MYLENLNFRKKLLVTFLVVFIPLISIGSTVSYYQIEKILQTSIEKELNDSIHSLTTLIQTAAQVSVRNRLRAIAEKNLDIARSYYAKYEAGEISETRMISTLKNIFLSQSIGSSGYIYCLDSKGIITAHPRPKVRGADLSQYSFIQEQLSKREGYLEYDWKNPGEPKASAKALYMVYFGPLDWIISVSSYREEFKDLVDMKDFQDSILSYKFGKTGYAYVLNEEGDLLVHPSIQGVNLLQQDKYPNTFLKQIIKEKNGKMEYFWKNPGETGSRKKIVLYKHIPAYGWIVASSSDVAEVFSPLKTFQILLLVLLLICFFSAIISFYWISGSVVRPLTLFMNKLEQGAKGDFSVRMNSPSHDEFGKLADHFNSFMAQLEENHKTIEEQNQNNILAQKALVENELKLRSLFNQSFQYIGILSPSGVLEEVNKSGVEFTGCPLEEVLYKTFWKLPYWQHDSNVRIQIKKAVKEAMSGSLIRLETTIMAKEQDIRNIDISIKPVIKISGEVAFIITEGRDITEFQLAAMERKNLAVQMEKAQKMEAIGTLAGGIAHDFNNILSGILGYAQLAALNVFKNPERAKGHISQIIQGSTRAAGLTKQILTFGRQTKYEKHPMVLAVILKEALKLLRSSIPVTIEMREKIIVDKVVMADTTKMHQVIMNLCTNAYHAIGEGSGVINVELNAVNINGEEDFFGQVMKNGEYIKLEISDTGTGMEKETLKKIFDPYFTTKDVGKGTGFGLSLVYAIIEEHEGYVRVESVPGKGSSFFVYLPVINTTEGPGIEEESGESTVSGNGRIMVVDDEKHIRNVLEEYLESRGYTVSVFENGMEALEAFKIAPEDYDLVLTDMTMPQMTGDRLAEHIMEVRNDMPVILCTGYSEIISEEQAYEIGIVKYMLKPLSNIEVGAAIHDVLDKKLKE